MVGPQRSFAAFLKHKIALKIDHCEWFGGRKRVIRTTTS